MSIDIRQFMRDAKENSKKLDECATHDFSVDMEPAKAYGKKYMCIKCKGKVDLAEKIWYERGLKHGRALK